MNQQQTNDCHASRALSARGGIQNFFFYLAAILISCFVLIFIFYSPDFSFYFPLRYSEDGLGNSVVVKSIIDNGWYLTNPYLAAPGMYNLAEYPMSDSASLLIVKILSCFSKNYAVVINSFYFLTFIFATLISLVIFERLGLKRWFALAASLLFSFLPYHLFRNEGHLLLTTYYVIPLYVLLSVYAYQSPSFSFKKILFFALIILFSASSGIYYALFGAFFILLAGLLGSLEQRNKKNIFFAMMLSVLIAFTLFLNVSPGFFYQLKNGKNTEIAFRAPAESELAGLKIIQLISPVNDHHLRGFRKSKEHYNQTAPLVNENRVATLGLIASLGFLALLFVLLLRNTELFFWSRLNVFAVLVATIGGFGAFFAYHVSSMIRSYNRISVFIAFFSLYAFFFLLQKFSNKKMGMAAVLILIIGLYDEIPLQSSITHYQDIKKQFTSDAEFITAIEKKLSENSMVFQLPYMYFPESPPINQMKDYDHFRGYLHSKKIQWSYGAVIGRPIAAWQKKVSALPLPKMIAELKKEKFSGIYIDRNGYTDHGKLLEKQMRGLLHAEPIVSPDQRFAFYLFS